MVVHHSSEPSSANTSPIPELNGSPVADLWIEHGSGDDGLISTGPTTGYVLFGSEIVQNAMDRDSEEEEGEEETESDEDSDAVRPESLGDVENLEQQQQKENEPNVTVAEQAFLNLSERDLDALLKRQLNSSDLEPRGAFGDPSLYTDPVRDTFQASLWNESLPSSASEIPISAEKADEIKNCMSNFQIPASQFPPWVTKISEHQWKAKLLDNLKSKK